MFILWLVRGVTACRAPIADGAGACAATRRLPSESESTVVCALSRRLAASFVSARNPQPKEQPAMPSGSESGGPEQEVRAPNRRRPSRPPRRRAGGAKVKAWRLRSAQIPWLMIGAVRCRVSPDRGPRGEHRAEVPGSAGEAAKYAAERRNQDPSVDDRRRRQGRLPGRACTSMPTQRVAYDQSPPFGGPHDAVWATCTGTVYAERRSAPRTRCTRSSTAPCGSPTTRTICRRRPVDDAEDKVDGSTYTMMSPYPGLDCPDLAAVVGPPAQGGQRRRRAHRPVHHLAAPEPVRLPRGRRELLDHPASFDPDEPAAVRSRPSPAPDAVPMDGGGIDPAPSGSGAERAARGSSSRPTCRYRPGSRP